METERPIKDCLAMLNRDIRIMNLAQAKKEPTSSIAELFAVLDQIQENAVRQLVTEPVAAVYQEVHCS